MLVPMHINFHLFEALIKNETSVTEMKCKIMIMLKVISLAENQNQN